MRDVDGILDFLEEYGLFQPPEERVRDPRIGIVGADEQVVEVDWEALTTPDFSLDDEFGQSPGLDADILGGLGRARDSGEERRLRDTALPPPWDSCAWYAPMHYYGPAWGIYIREDCVLRLALEIGWFVWDSPRTMQTATDLKNAAFLALFLHEHFHHKLEGFGIRLALADRAAPDHYVRYDASVYRASVGTDQNLEEALANADAYQRVANDPYKRVLPPKIRTALRRWMKWRFKYIDPPGYRMAQHYLRGQDFVAGAETLQTQVFEASLTPTSNPAHWQAGPHLLRSVFSITSDIYLIIPVGAIASFPTRSRPYTVSVRQTQEWLRRNGFAILPGRGKGDHERYERADGMQIGLDGGARELSRQIERTIARALNVSQREFRTAVSEGRPVPASVE
jgi:hypothetical protein